MAERQTQIQIPERAPDEPPATAEQLQVIRQLSQGRSLQGYRFDYRKLGYHQAATITKQLQAMTMTDQPTPSIRPTKQGPGCIASLAKGTTALIVFAVVLAGVAGGAYLIYNHIQNNPKPTASNTTPDPQDNPENPADRSNTPNTTGSTIFEGLDASDTPDPPIDPASDPQTPNRTTEPEPQTPETAEPPAPTVDRSMLRQLAGLEDMLVKLSQYTRSNFAPDIRAQSSQAMHKKLVDYPDALAALDAADPTASLRIRAVIDAFAADQLDGLALRQDIKTLRQAIEKLQ